MRICIVSGTLVCISSLNLSPFSQNTFLLTFWLVRNLRLSLTWDQCFPSGPSNSIHPPLCGSAFQEESFWRFVWINYMLTCHLSTSATWSFNVQIKKRFGRPGSQCSCRSNDSANRCTYTHWSELNPHNKIIYLRIRVI